MHNSVLTIGRKKKAVCRLDEEFRRNVILLYGMGKKILVFIHILYWLYVFPLSEMINKLAYQQRTIGFHDLISPVAISNYFIFSTIFYLNYFLILPAFFQTKRYLLTLGCWILLLVLFIAARYYVQEIFLPLHFDTCNYCHEKLGIYVVNNFFQGLSNLILASTVIWFVDNWLRLERHRIRLEQEKTIAERSLLQSQVNPHFLFNTLNNIYSLVYHHSSNSLAAIQKLADIMRYSVREEKANSVTLAVELSYLKNYIDLQKMRVKDPAVVYDEVIDDTNYVIIPMLLISFVENAFKHGVFNDAQHPLTIKITCRAGDLNLIVFNKVNNNVDESSGIGHSNVKKRLELHYPKKYTIQLANHEGFYTSQLLVKLSV